MIQTLISEGASAIVVNMNQPDLEGEANHTYSRVDSGDLPRDLKEKLYVAYHGLGSIFHSSNVRTGTLVQGSTSLYKVSHQFSFIEIRDRISYNESLAFSKSDE